MILTFEVNCQPYDQFHLAGKRMDFAQQQLRARVMMLDQSVELKLVELGKLIGGIIRTLDVNDVSK
jgi:hypothetical protein